MAYIHKDAEAFGPKQGVTIKVKGEGMATMAP